MRIRTWLVCLWLFSSTLAGSAESRVNTAEKPNILVILCDDLGYGDVSCLNPECKLRTPNIDRLAREGVAFTDAHSSSAVCTPTRYSLLTGRYAWRSRLQKGVLGGMSPPLIEPHVRTVADVLREQGYDTACFGKWHLGFDWPRKPDTPPFTDEIERGSDGWRVDFAKPFRGGPLDVGFNRYFGIAGSLDMVPYTFLKDNAVTVIPTVDKEFPMMLGHEGGNSRKGPAAADFEANQVLPKLTEQTISFIAEHAEHSGKNANPFFCYVPLASPHTPIVPNSAWQGRSRTNFYGDFVEETDAAIGEILDSLDKHKLTENTLVIVTSDNGCSPQAKYAELAQFGHNPSYLFRGHKADIFEGGHRVPYIARWPQHLPRGQQCSALIGLQDTFATCADMIGLKLTDTVAVDSFSWLPHLMPKTSSQPVRTSLVHHSINGSFAIRRGDYKLCFCPDSGGWSEPHPGSQAAKKLPPRQLYNLKDDIGERTNLAATEIDKVKELTTELKGLIANGRSNEGPDQQNSVTVVWHE